MSPPLIPISRTRTTPGIIRMAPRAGVSIMDFTISLHARPAVFALTGKELKVLEAKNAEQT